MPLPQKSLEKMPQRRGAPGCTLALLTIAHTSSGRNLPCKELLAAHPGHGAESPRAGGGVVAALSGREGDQGNLSAVLAMLCALIISPLRVCWGNLTGGHLQAPDQGALSRCAPGTPACAQGEGSGRRRPGHPRLFSIPDNSGGPRPCAPSGSALLSHLCLCRLLPRLSAPTAPTRVIAASRRGWKQQGNGASKRPSENRERFSLRWTSCPPCPGLFRDDTGCFP